MREEQVTKHLLRWLLNNHWDIVCFDFPQSGTGRFLHPNKSDEKNKGAINPDIVAVKEDVCVFFENKDRYYHPDFEKVNDLIVESSYSDDINKLLAAYRINYYYYGIGLPEKKYSTNAKKDSELVDFVVGIQENGTIVELYFDKSKKSPF